ncbi:MAG: radical SAM protein [Acidobacteria bacterium]|nr:MAG: radical SAM protein [Acidobacteriota bacterium]
MKLYRPQKIFIESAVAESQITSNVVQSLPDVPVEIISSSQPLLESAREQAPTLSRAKKYLLLAEHRGRFLKHCPGGKGRLGIQNVCCNYLVINYATNCHMDCSYCYLQSYLNFPYLTVYANHLDLITELESAFSVDRSRFFRVGTGELADSLALDLFTRYSVPLVEFFASQANAVLELKTKTDLVTNLLGLRHERHTVLAWSVNPPRLQKTDEHKTAAIPDRLTAARKCVDAGYQVAFHFDPIVQYAGWETDYHRLVDQIFDLIPAASVAWISLGALRMTGALKQVIRRRFPKSPLPFGELVPGEDGKLRYFKPVRVEIYQSMKKWIGLRAPAVPVYLCMEKPDVWTKVFGEVPADEPALQDAICACLQ